MNLRKDHYRKAKDRPHVLSLPGKERAVPPAVSLRTNLSHPTPRQGGAPTVLPRVNRSSAASAGGESGAPGPEPARRRLIRQPPWDACRAHEPVVPWRSNYITSEPLRVSGSKTESGPPRRFSGGRATVEVPTSWRRGAAPVRFFAWNGVDLSPTAGPRWAGSSLAPRRWRCGL